MEKVREISVRQPCRAGYLPSTPNAPTYTEIRGEREAELIRRYQAGDQAAGGILVQAHAALIFNYARRYFRFIAEADHDDVMQAARMGFLRGVEKFEPARGFLLSTYVQHWIRHDASRYVEDHATIVRVPVHIQQAARKARRLGVPVGEVDAPGAAIAAEVAHYHFRGASLDTPVSGEDDRTIGDFLVDTTTSPEVEVADAEQQAERKRVIAAAMRCLTPQEAEVIRRRLLADEPETLEEVGQDHGLSRERIRQIEVKALAKLRRAIVLNSPQRHA